MSNIAKLLAISVVLGALVGCSTSTPTADTGSTNRGAAFKGGASTEPQQRGKAIQEPTIPPPPNK